MAFSYDQIEDEIVAYLAPLMPAAEVVIMPEKESEYQRSIEKPRLCVMYGGSDFEKPQSTNEVSQIEFVNVVISIRCRNRRGVNGIHGVSGDVKKHLLGFRLSNTDRLFLKSVDFEERKEQSNEWFYTITFQAKKLQVQQYASPPEYGGALLQQVILNDKVELPDTGSNN